MFIEAIIFRLEDILHNFINSEYFLDFLSENGLILDMPRYCLKDMLEFEECLYKLMRGKKKLFFDILNKVNIEEINIRKDILERIISFKGKGAKIFFTSLFPQSICEDFLRKNKLLEVIDGYICGEYDFRDYVRISYILNKYMIKQEKTIYVTFSKRYKNFKGFIISPDGFLKIDEFEKEIY